MKPINGFNHKHTILVATVLTCLLCSCASERGQTPDTSPLSLESLGQMTSPDANPIAIGNWWQVLSSPELNQLVSQAIAQNPSMQMAQARIRSAQAQQDLGTAGEGPQIDLQGMRNRQHLSAYGLLPPPFGNRWVNLNQLSLNLAWHIDFWGQVRHRVKAAEFQKQAAQLQKQAMQQWLASTVVTAFVQRNAALESLKLAEQTQTLAEKQLSLAQSVVTSGITSADLSDQAQMQLNKAIADKAGAQALLDESEHTLAMLTGSSNAKIRGLPYWSLPNWQIKTTDLHLNAVAARPDVQASLAAIHSAQEGIKAAKADFYPNIGLQAAVGLSAQETSDLFTRAARIVSIAPAFDLPIFHSGALNAALDQRTAQYDSAVANYNQTVLNAIKDSADALSVNQAAQQSYHQASQALQAQQAIEKRTQAKYQAGMIGLSTLLSIQQQTLALAQQQNKALAQILMSQSSLIRALGSAQSLS